MTAEVIAIDDAVCTNPLAVAPDGERILLIRLGAVGDVVRTLPAASLLRRSFPDRHMTWLVEPSAESAVRGQPWVDDVLVFPRPGPRGAGERRDIRGSLRTLNQVRDFWRDLRGRQFDLVIDFHAILKSGFFFVVDSGTHARDLRAALRARRRLAFRDPPR